MPHKLDYHNLDKRDPDEHDLANQWRLDEWPDEIIAYHQMAQNVTRAYVAPVRCRECKHWIPWAKDTKYEKYECWANGEPFDTEPDGYCAWGERR